MVLFPYTTLFRSSFGGLKAVDNLSFHINDGEIYGLIGPNGAGKTTVFNCITQFCLPNKGKVLFKTSSGEIKNLVGEKTHEIIKLGLVRTFQNVEVIGDLTWETYMTALESKPVENPLGGVIDFSNGQRFGTQEMSLVKMNPDSEIGWDEFKPIQGINEIIKK